MPPNEKETYQKETKTKLKKLKTRKTTRKAEADPEVRYDQKMQQIRGQYAQTKEKLEELRESNLNEWLEPKQGWRKD